MVGSSSNRLPESVCDRADVKADDRTASVLPQSGATAPGSESPPTTFRGWPETPPDMPESAEESTDEASASLAAMAENHASPWLFSLIVHMLLVIILGLWIIAAEPRREILLEATYTEDQGAQLEEDVVLFDTKSSATDEQTITVDSLLEVDDPFATPPPIELALDGSLMNSEFVSPQLGLALRGRDPGMKQALLEAYGGNAESESAVFRGLEWLARRQRPRGSWSLRGPYSQGAGFENHIAATAMALLAFQGAGHTHQQGRFSENVSKGVEFLLATIDSDGNFSGDRRSNDLLYTQGQATIVLCELYAMTRDPSLLEAAQRAVNYCVEAQDVQGGWRYTPGAGSDTSVTGWVVMALQSARMAGLQVPQSTLDKVNMYLDLASSHEGSRYAYRPDHAPSEVMTAEALLCRQYLGWNRYDERLIRGVDYLAQQENLPSWSDRNVYYWYYASQVLHHMESEHWELWNSTLRDMLVTHQVKTGQESGSWHPMNPQPDRWGFHGGRLYVTCLSIYVLEVYYRHMPLYSHRVVAQP